MSAQLTVKAPKRKALNPDVDLIKLITRFDTDEKCRIALEKLRWPLGVRCIRCGSEKISRNYKRNQFECDPCGYHFSVTAGTIFHDSHLPLRKWFIAIYLICESKRASLLCNSNARWALPIRPHGICATGFAKRLRMMLIAIFSVA